MAKKAVRGPARKVTPVAPQNASMLLKLILPAPRQASKDPLYNIQNFLSRAYKSVVLVKGQKRVIIHGDGAKNVGLIMKEWISAVLMVATSGRGNATDGLTQWVVQNQKNEILARLNDYTITAVGNGRGGTYEGRFGDFVDVAGAKAKFVVPSITKFPRTKNVRSTKTKSPEDGELVEVML